ncbi:MAG TPA: hypothetical protein ENO16_06465 [Chromatiales bacterium]|nr:hypothetical protein [Chromatiales bacterium]
MHCYSDWVVFSSLEGPLLEHDSSCMDPARLAIERLAGLHVPLILVSSQTLAEVLALALPGPAQPLILEHGAVLAVPEGYFPRFDGDFRESGYRMVCFSPPHRYILEVLERLRGQGYAFETLAERNLDSMARLGGLLTEAVHLLPWRHGSETLLWMDSPAQRAGFEQALLEHGLRLEEGEDCLRVLGVGAEKGRAMRGLLGLYRLHDWPLRGTVALGDSPSDLGMLRNADRPVVVRRADGSWLDVAQVPRGRYTRGMGLEGWHEGVGQWLVERGYQSAEEPLMLA